MDYEQEAVIYEKDNISELERQATCGLVLQELFTDYVYKERNRCAHNTRSYQHNLPSIKEMMSKGYKLQNYFYTCQSSSC